MLDFPSSPSNAQVYNSPNGTSWIWDGAKWTSAAFTNVYVDNHYRNRIINGDMSVDQRNGGAQIAAPTVNTYIIDRWKYGPSTVASKGNVGVVAVSNAPAGFPFIYAFNFTTTTAYSTPAAAERVQVFQYIEGINFLDAQWGTANAQPVVLEFWASAATAGTYAVGLSNAAGNRSYVATFTISAANVWQKLRINIPGDTAGTWAVAGSALMVALAFPLCTGSTNTTSTPNTWIAGYFISATGATNVLGAVNNALSITGVALMVGAAAANAEPEFRKYSDNLIDCQRYFFKPPGTVSGSGYGATAGASLGNTLRPFPVTMRAAPTQSGATFVNMANANTPTLSNQNSNGSTWQAVNTAAGAFWYSVNNELYDADF